MEMLPIFLWIVYPYSVAAIVAMGLVWQYDASRDEGKRSKAGSFLLVVVKTLMAASTATGIAILLTSSLANEPILL